MRQFLLQAASVGGPRDFTLKLIEHANGDGPGANATIASNRVGLGGAGSAFDALLDLHSECRALSKRDPDHWLEHEVELMRDLGAWTTEHLLGEIADRLAAQAPATVWIDIRDPGLEWMMQVPLGIAIVNGGSLTSTGVTFVVLTSPPNGFTGAAEINGRLRVLAVFSSPTEVTALNLRQERHRIEFIARELIGAGKAIDLKILQYGATRRDLEQALEDGEGWDVVHLSGHGKVGSLFFEAADGRPVEVTTDQLVSWLKNVERLKLVTLTACLSGAIAVESARRLMGYGPAQPAAEPVDDDSVHSLAIEISSKVGCAVVAMRYPVADGFAIDFAESFYSRTWRSNQPPIGALRLTSKDETVTAPSSSSPPRSPFTPVLFSNLNIAAISLAPPERATNNPVVMYPKMTGFLKEPEIFVGRVGLLAAANAALTYGSPYSAVILHGTPGVGKTRCELELAYGRQDHFSHLRFIPITPAGPDFNRCADELAGIFGLQADRAEEFERWLAEITQAVENSGVLLVFDDLDVLLDVDGSWLDARWGRLFDALCDHDGRGRILATSRRVPSTLGPHALSLPVANLSVNDTFLFIRNLPRLAKMMEDPNSQGKLREILLATRGHPTLLELANRYAGEEELSTLLEAAKARWTESGIDRQGGLGEDPPEADEQHDRLFTDLVDTWTGQANAQAAPVPVPDLPAPTPEGRAAFEEGETLRAEGRTNQAEEAYGRAVANGDPEAALRLGNLLWQGGRADEAKVAFTQAAGAGLDEAKYQLGWLLLNEERDQNGAKEWWRNAVDDGNAQAAFRLGELSWTEGRPDDAAAFYRQAAERGHRQAAYQLGWLSLNERDDANEAIQWWEQAADPNPVGANDPLPGGDDVAHIEAAYRAGELLWRTDKPEEAAVWYRRAATHGHDKAAFQLGKLQFQRGKVDDALEWMERAAKAGVPCADTELDRMRGVK